MPFIFESVRLQPWSVLRECVRNFVAMFDAPPFSQPRRQTRRLCSSTACDAQSKGRWATKFCQVSGECVLILQLWVPRHSMNNFGI